MVDLKLIYGKEPEDMTEGEFKMVVLSTMHGMNCRLDKINGKVKDIPWMKWTLRVLWVIAPALITWLVWLTRCSVGV